MPNYCQNILTVEGTREEVESFKELIRKEANGVVENFSFSSVIPCPDPDYDDLDPEYDTWRDDHWDTKWPAKDVSEWTLEKEENGIVKEQLSFLTAWSPPIAVYEDLYKICANRFSSLEFEGHFYEPGFVCAGVYSKDGYELACDMTDSIMYKKEDFPYANENN